MHVRVHMTPQIASSCARIRSLGTRLTHTHARALRFRPSPFCIAHAQIFTTRYLARLRSADASLLPPAWTTSLVLCAVLQECLIHMGNFFAKQPRRQQRRIHEDFATSLVRCVVFVLWFFFELYWAIPDNKDTPPLRSILLKTPKTVMRLAFYPPDKLFCQDLPLKTNYFSSMVPSLSIISV